MAGQVNADTRAVQLEVVASEVPVAYERDDTFISMIEKRGNEEDVSSRGLRMSVQVRPGGRFRQTSFDNGALGRGGASQYLEMNITPIDLVFAVELSKKVQITSDNRKKALFDVVNRETASALKQARTAIDILAQGPGSGVLGTATTISGTTWTLPATGTKTSWFYTGQGVELYTSNMVTKRTGVAIITAIDPVANTLTVDALPSGGVSGDVIVLEGLTAGAGLSQSLNGLAALVSSANTGTYQGVNRANYPEIRATEFPAGGAALSLPMGRVLINKMAKRLGIDFATGSGITWWGNVDQKAAIEDIAQTMILINKTPSATQKFDGAFDVDTFVGLPTKWGIHADPTMLWALKFKTFTRAVSMPLKLYTVPGPGAGGQTAFPIYAADGSIQATGAWWYATSFQIGCGAPFANGVISALAPEAGL